VGLIDNEFIDFVSRELSRVFFNVIFFYISFLLFIYLFMFFLQNIHWCKIFNMYNPSLKMNETSTFIGLFHPSEQWIRYLAAVSITGDRAANLDQSFLISVRVLLRATPVAKRDSIYTVSSDGPVPSSHIGIRTPDV
jgi:hypothetical protein